MTDYTYAWTSAEQDGLTRTAPDGTSACVPADPANRDYAGFLSSGAVAADYVAPPAPPEPTAEEKLAASGLTLDDLAHLMEKIQHGGSAAASASKRSARK